MLIIVLVLASTLHGGFVNRVNMPQQSLDDLADLKYFSGNRAIMEIPSEDKWSDKPCVYTLALLLSLLLSIDLVSLHPKPSQPTTSLND